MKFLIDNQLPKALAEHLSKRGHDCEHVLDVGLSSASDHCIARYAEAQERVLITKDEDFLYLANQPNSKLKLVWVRLGIAESRFCWPLWTPSGPPSSRALRQGIASSKSAKPWRVGTLRL